MSSDSEERTGEPLMGSVPDKETVDQIAALCDGLTKFNEPLSEHTTIGVGGPALVWLRPKSEGSALRILNACAQQGIRHFVIGAGSNLLVRDGGYPGVVINLNHAFKKVQLKNSRLTAGAGTPVGTVIKKCAQAGQSGLEMLAGVPGTIGGALATNAGVDDWSISDVLDHVELVAGGETKEVDRDEITFSYRSSNLAELGVVLRASFLLNKAPTPQIQSRINGMLFKRRSTQPQKTKSAGCIFKNPPEAPAGKIIDELGFKGKKLGGAVVSDVHANWIVNVELASASEIIELIEKIEAAVEKKRGIKLERELEIVGVD